MPEWAAREFRVEQILDETPPRNVLKIRGRVRIEIAIARHGTISAAMRETGCTYAQAHAMLRWMEAA